MADQSTPRMTTTYPKQVKVPPRLTPDHVLDELKAMLGSQNVDVTFVFSASLTGGEFSLLGNRCVEAMQARLNDPTVTVTAGWVRRGADFNFVTLNLSRQ